jgi:hypothetical protein
VDDQRSPPKNSVLHSVIQPWDRSRLIDSVKIDIEEFVDEEMSIRNEEIKEQIKEQASIRNEKIKERLTRIFVSNIDRITGTTNNVQSDPAWSPGHHPHLGDTPESSNSTLKRFGGSRPSFSKLLISANRESSVTQWGYINSDEMAPSYDYIPNQLSSGFGMFGDTGTPDQTMWNDSRDKTDTKVYKGKRRAPTRNESSDSGSMPVPENGSLYSGGRQTDLQSNDNAAVIPNHANPAQSSSSSSHIMRQMSENPGPMATNSDNTDHGNMRFLDVNIGERASELSSFWDSQNVLEEELQVMQNWWQEN